MAIMELRPAYPVRSARLLLRLLTEKDATALISCRSLPEVCRYVPFGPMDEAELGLVYPLERRERLRLPPRPRGEGLCDRGGAPCAPPGLRRPGLTPSGRPDRRRKRSLGPTGSPPGHAPAHLVENEWFKGRWHDELDFALLVRG